MNESNVFLYGMRKALKKYIIKEVEPGTPINGPFLKTSIIKVNLMSLHS